MSVKKSLVQHIGVVGTNCNINHFDYGAGFEVDSVCNGQILNNVLQQISETSSQAHFRRASTYVRRSQIKESINELTLALKIEPSNPFLWHNRGRLYLIIKQNSLAINDFMAAIKLNPNNENFKNDLIHAIVTSK